MITLVAFSEINAGATEELCAAVPDQTHYTEGDDLQIGAMPLLVGAYAKAYALGDCRLVSPSIRGKADLYISPLVNDAGGYAPYYPRRIDWRGDCPFPLVTGENLNAYTQQTGVAADQNRIVGIWLADAAPTPVKGEIWTVKAYATGKTIVEKAWTSFELTWLPDLPVGRYAIVGARCYMIDGGLFRFVPREAPNRPGGVCLHEHSLVSDPIQRLGNMGVWCEFNSSLPPMLEALPYLVAGSSEVYLRVDLMKVG